MKCEKCNKEIDYKPNVIEDMDSWGTGNVKDIQVCDECENNYQDVLYYSEFNE